MSSQLSEILPHSKSKVYFSALTGLRAVAAYLVFVTHSKAGKDLLPDSIINVLGIVGLNCMTFFFMLSGFVIAIRYSEDFQSGNFPVKKFYLNRFARIYPLFFLLLVLHFALQKNFNAYQWFLNLTFLKGFFDTEKFTGIAASWSLTAEITFYLTAPWLFNYFKKYKLLPVLFITFIGIAVVSISKALGSVSFMNSLGFALEYTFFGLCFEFFCGYYLYDFYISRLKNHHSDNSNSGFPKFTLIGIAGAIGCLILEVISNANFAPLPDGITAIILINNYLLPVAFFFLFYGLITETTILSKILSSEIGQILGKSSFAFYLIHGGIFYETLYFHVSKNKLVIFLVLNIIAIALHKFIEEPINKLILQKSRNMKIRFAGSKS